MKAWFSAMPQNAEFFRDMYGRMFQPSTTETKD